MREGVLYAKTEEGLELPVIDVMNPAFAVAATNEELGAMTEQFIREEVQRREMPGALREAMQQSRLGKSLMAAAGTFVDGMTTYQLKLGPENLGEDASAMDVRIAASFPAFTTRLRLQDMARLLADGLAASAAAAPPRPVCLVNIGGGAAADSWNALIVLRRAGLLAGRKIAIAVMDMDSRGPAFGRRAIEALCEAGAPLNGMDIEFQHFSYEWSEAGRLRGILDGLRARDVLCGISSEGGLFEYGSDEEIVSNLEVLHGGMAADAVVAGSVTRDGGPVRASLGASRIRTRPRTMEAFGTLAEQGGWRVQEVIERPFSHNVRLVKGCC